MATPTMNRKLTIDDILDLRAYERVREESRSAIIETKRKRRVSLGTIVTLMFENRATMLNQIHEMLRAEKVVNDDLVYEELKAYNPLIPEAGQLSATLFIELTSDDQMPAQLARLIGIEDRCYVQVADFARVWAIADEDLDRENEEKTSAVHFVRFELTPDMKSALKGGAQMMIGCDHPNYLVHLEELPQETLAALLKDLS